MLHYVVFQALLILERSKQDHLFDQFLIYQASFMLQKERTSMFYPHCKTHKVKYKIQNKQQQHEILGGITHYIEII